MHQTVHLCILRMRRDSTSESDSSSEDEQAHYVLPENVYVKKMEEIIEKRYFPDNKQLRSVLTGDTHTATALKKDASARHLAYTPTLDQLKELKSEKEVSTTNLTLDNFLSTYMGEDNFSYEKLAQKERLKQLEENKHFYSNEDQHYLEAPPDKDGRLHIMSHNAWKYTTENALMFNPSGVDYNSNEVLNNTSQSRPAIDPKATRLELTIDPYVQLKLNQIKKDKLQDRWKQGKLGIDGNFSCNPASQNNTGIDDNHSPLSTLVEYAQPEAQVPASPLMTWGYIDSTPCRLDSSTKKSVGEFSMPPISEREEIAYNLGSGISKNNAGSIFKTPMSTPRFITKKLAKNTPIMLSPAAKRLMNNQKLSKTSVLTSIRSRALKTPTPIIRGIVTPRKPTTK